MAFHHEPDDSEVMSEINMTPLVDVMLVLLIIFMIAMPLLNHSIDVNLPQAQNQPVKDKPEAVTLTVTRQAKVHWNSQAVSRQVLLQKLAQLAQKNGQAQIYLRADRKVAYEHVVTLMADIRRLGLVNLGFITDPL